MEQSQSHGIPIPLHHRRKSSRQKAPVGPELSKTEQLSLFSTESEKMLEDNVYLERKASEIVQPVALERQELSVIKSHRSKILSKRNKNFSGSIARSSSTPGQENVRSAPETYDFLRIARRSLSSSRHKEESSESSRSSPKQLQPRFFQEETAVGMKIAEDESKLQAELSSDSQIAFESKLQKNLRKFEGQRKRFEAEKKKFEREQRELAKIRYKHLENSDRKRLVEVYRKLSDHVYFPNNSDDKEILLKKFLESQCQFVKQTTRDIQGNSFENDMVTYQTEISPLPVFECPDYESSTASMSDSEINSVSCALTDLSDNVISQIESVAKPVSHSELNADGLCQRGSRRRRSSTKSLIGALKQNKNIKEVILQKKSFLNRIFSFLSLRLKQDKKLKDLQHPTKEFTNERLVKTFDQNLFIKSRQVWQKTKIDYSNEVRQIRVLRNKCFSHLIVLIIFCGFGGLTFRFIEGSFENNYKCGVGRVKRDFIDYLWYTSHNLREEDWKSSARTKLRKFEEELHAAHESGMTTYSGSRSWTFVNSALYCWTVVTTIGYGHISPTTVVGRSVTIVYAIIGIPIFLILLADFGKLFTRGIKFLWVFVRRLYYTGTFRKIRKHQHVQNMMHGMNIVYEIAMRRPTIANLDGLDEENGTNLKVLETTQSIHDHYDSTVGTPTSPIPETYLVDDEFNLPISVAIVILLLYIFVGAAVYCIWEDWTYFESVYFVFISMSTVGFGDFVPQHPIFMMCSIAYLIFGLALTSMCINVVQVKLSDSFRQASAKISATIGFEMSDEEAMTTQNQTPIEEASIHSPPRFERTSLNASKTNLQRTTAKDTSPPPIPRKLPVKTRDNDKEKEQDNKKEKENK